MAPPDRPSPRAGATGVARQVRNLRRNERPHDCQPRPSGRIRDGIDKVKTSGKRLAIEYRFQQAKPSFYGLTFRPRREARDDWLVRAQIAWRRESPERSGTEAGAGAPFDQIRQTNSRAQMVRRNFPSSISFGANKRFVAANDGFEGAVGRSAGPRRAYARRFQPAVFLSSARGDSRGCFLVRTHAAFSMIASPEPGGPTRSSSCRQRASREDRVRHWGLARDFKSIVRETP